MADTQSHINPLRGRFNAWLLAKFEDDFHEEVGPRKSRHIGELSGTVVEIGAGNGVNFRYYPRGTRVIVFEPNPFMHKRLHTAGQAHGLDYELRAASAEQLDLPDESVDAAVCTLVYRSGPGTGSRRNPSRIEARRQILLHRTRCCRAGDDLAQGAESFGAPLALVIRGLPHQPGDGAPAFGSRVQSGGDRAIQIGENATRHRTADRRCGYQIAPKPVSAWQAM